MENKLKQWTEKFNVLPIRIRILITVAGVMIVFLLIDLLWFSPNNSREKNLKYQIEQIDKQIAEFVESQNEINAGIYNQRNDPKRIALREIETQLVATQQQLEQRALNLVKPDAMAQLLTQIIQNSGKLTLVSLIKQPPQALFDQKVDSLQKENTVQMYRHPIALTLSGDFASTQTFLAELENMPQKVNFEQLQYSVEEYPKSKIVLVVSTLSLSRKWIGG